MNTADLNEFNRLYRLADTLNKIMLREDVGLVAKGFAMKVADDIDSSMMLALVRTTLEDGEYVTRRIANVSDTWGMFTWARAHLLEVE